MRTRTQGIDKLTSDFLGTKFTYYLGKIDSSVNLYSGSYYPNYKVTTDEVHPQYPYEGGPFASRSMSVQFSDFGPHLGGTFFFHPTFKYWMTSGWPEYSKFRIQIRYGTKRVPSDNTSYVEGLGPEAWNRYKPIKPSSSMAQTIAELRDIRQLAISKLRFFQNFVLRMKEVAKKGGSAYLAVQFGWVPTVTDFLSFYHDIKSIDRKIASLRKKNGKWMRRTGTLFEEDNTSSSTGTTVGITPATYLSNHSWTVESHIYERAWFKGVMRYYIPQLDSPFWGKLRGLEEVSGLSVDPELLYNLTPWTWLFDWFSNLGAVVSNLQSQISDQVAAKYAYVMYNKRQSFRQQSTARLVYCNVYPNVAKYTNISCSGTCTLEEKYRVEASPFGFSLQMPDLTAWQLSILSALGLSKLKH